MRSLGISPMMPYSAQKKKKKKHDEKVDGRVVRTTTISKSPIAKKGKHTSFLFPLVSQICSKNVFRNSSSCEQDWTGFLEEDGRWAEALGE